jgi:chromosomal replication initiation ATPase DnaA
LDGWGRWPVAAALLTGPRKSGRSLLGRVFAAKSGGMLADNAERHAEDYLFHIWNQAQEERRPLLIIADYPPPQWRIALPDLASRLRATPCITLSDPDEELVVALFAKLLKQRGIGVSGEVLRYLSARIERTHVNVIRTVEALDDMALAQNRSITIPLARDALNEVGLMSYDGQHA